MTLQLSQLQFFVFFIGNGNCASLNEWAEDNCLQPRGEQTWQKEWFPWHARDPFVSRTSLEIKWIIGSQVLKCRGGGRTKALDYGFSQQQSFATTRRANMTKTNSTVCPGHICVSEQGSNLNEPLVSSIYDKYINAMHASHLWISISSFRH